MIVWTFVLASFGGFGVFVTLLEPPRATTAEGNSARKARNQTRNQERDRSPASAQSELGVESVPALGAQPKDDLARFQVVDLILPCQTKGQTTLSEASPLGANVQQVRLTGSPCQPGQTLESTEIRNDTNGFSATVFPTGPRTFTTDYITLSPGPNKIRILHVFAKGAREEREWTIVRQIDQNP